MTTENTTTYVSDLEDIEETSAEETTSGIAESMTREQFLEYFRENREIQYNDITIGVMEWGDGRFDVLTPAQNEDGYITLNPTPYANACDAINFAVDYLVEQDNKKVSTKSSKKKSKPKQPKYNGPRTVRVFSRDIYIEENIDATYEDIRVKLVTEYDLPNFKKDKVFFDFDESTGTLEVLLKFNTKG